MASGSRKSYARIDGLRDFLKDVGVVDSEMDRAERIFQTIAAATVIATARDYAATEGRQQQSQANRNLKQLGAGTVQFGGEAWSLGAEFGSLVHGQFPAWRGNRDDAGYFFWPAIRDFRDEDMLNLWVREVWTVVEGLFSN